MAGVDEDDDCVGDPLRVVAEPVLDGQGGAEFGGAPVVVPEAAVEGEVHESSGGVVVEVRSVDSPAVLESVVSGRAAGWRASAPNAGFARRRCIGVAGSGPAAGRAEGAKTSDRSGL